MDDHDGNAIFGPGLGDDLEDDIDCLVIDEDHSGFTVATDLNANVAKSAVACEDVDECATKSTDIRGRVLTRSQSRAISASADGLDATLVPSHGGPQRTRSSSRRRKRSCPPMRQLTPPPQQPDRRMEEVALKEYLKKVELQSKSYIQRHNRHNCFGQRPESLRPVNCVARGGMSIRSLRRWTQGWGRPFASDGGYAEGYYDADETYYSDPEVLNPPKRSPRRVKRLKMGTDVNAPGPSSQVVPVDAASLSRDVPMDVDELAVVKVPEPIIRSSRSFETRPWTRLSKRPKRVVKMNVAGILCNVLDDIDDSTGRMEDRRSQWTIDRKIAEALRKESYASMSDEEYDDAVEARTNLKEKKLEKKHRRMEPQRLRALHANAKDTVVVGDEYIGHQNKAVEVATEKMASLLVKQTVEWTAPRMGGQSRPSLKWIDLVDRAGDIDGGHVGGFTSDEALDPLEDITLIRAKAGVTIEYFHKLRNFESLNFVSLVTPL